MSGAREQNRTAKRWIHPYLPLFSFVLCVVLSVAAMGDGAFQPLYPEATGAQVIEKGGFTVDVSNATEGYIMVKHKGTDKRLKMKVVYDSATTATYDVNGAGEYEVFPLSLGSGEYSVEGYLQAEGVKYTREMRRSFQVSLPDPDRAFLYPNAFVWFTPQTQAVAKSMELCAGLTTDLEKVNVLYDYVGEQISYDYVKALTVSANRNYMPDVDETLSTKTGICFDQAALLACMLRVQGIPTQLVIGDLVPMAQYHAWTKVKIDGLWYLFDPTFYKSDYSAKDYAMERYY